MRRNLRFAICDLRFGKTKFVLPFAILFFICGCQTAPKPVSVNPAASFPANAFITQRAIFYAGLKQIPLNGYLAMSETGGKRLLVTGPLEMIMADVLVKPDGKIFVLKTSRMFSARDIRFGVASDLQNIFGGAPLLPAPVQMPETNRFVIHHGRYVLDLRVVEIKTGAQPESMFDEPKF